MSGNAVADAAEKDLQEKKEERIREFKKERGAIWLTITAAAKRAKISRVTLYKWIDKGIVPAEAVLVEDDDITKVNTDELNRIAAARSSNKPGETTKKVAEEVALKDAKIKAQEATIDHLTEQVNSLKQITHQTDKRIEDKDSAIAREKEVAERERASAMKIEADLREQLAEAKLNLRKAEERAEAAEKEAREEAKKGVMGKLFS